MSSFECYLLLKPSIQDWNTVIIGTERRARLGTFQNATYIIHLKLFFFKIDIFKSSRSFENGEFDLIGTGYTRQILRKLLQKP